MNPEERKGILEFLKQSERLKNTLRSGFTSAGRQESVAEHTWRLCLMALVMEEYFECADLSKVIRMAVVHDLGEAIRGDVPAPDQTPSGRRAEQERADLVKLAGSLPEKIRTTILELWDEYNRAATPEARITKGLDKLETMLQHNQGKNPPDFDYGFNLQYGLKHTSMHPVTAALRKEIDAETSENSNRSKK